MASRTTITSAFGTLGDVSSSVDNRTITSAMGALPSVETTDIIRVFLETDDGCLIVTDTGEAILIT